MAEPARNPATLAKFRGRLVASLCGVFLFAINAAVYATWPHLVVAFRRNVGYWPNIAEPRSVNDKITWRKVFDRNPLFPVLQDKLAARQFVAARCPELALPEILWSGTDPFAIPFDRIREPVVIKANHGCGFNYFIRDPQKIDRVGIWAFCTGVLNDSWGADSGEWAYRSIKPAIFIEKLLLKDNGSFPDDCKINVFCGRSDIFSWTTGRFGHRNTVYFDRENRHVQASLDGFDTSIVPTPTPLHDQARALVEKVCPELDAIRVDCYIHDGRVWFGEFTIYPGSGYQIYEPPSFGVERARRWDIVMSHYFTVPGRFRRLYRRCLEIRSRRHAAGVTAEITAPAANGTAGGRTAPGQ